MTLRSVAIGAAVATRVAAIIPARNEEATIAAAVRGAYSGGVDDVLVVDNGSGDETALRASLAGAAVVREARPGYGAACLAGIAALPGDTDVVLFLDGDGSDDPGDISTVVDPVLRNDADLVVGSRTRGACDAGALTPIQRIGNRFAGRLLSVLFGVPTTDLGPMRAIRKEALDRLSMRDRGYGWTAEMQARAAFRGLRVLEVPVRYHRRAGGRSKVSGTVRGTIGASAKILWTLLVIRFAGR